MNIAPSRINQIDFYRLELKNDEIKKNQEIPKNDVRIDIKDENSVRDLAIHVENSMVEGGQYDRVGEERMSERWIWKKLDKILFLTCTIGGMFLFIRIPAYISQFTLVAAGVKIGFETTLNNPTYLTPEGQIGLTNKIKVIKEFLFEMEKAKSDPHLFSRFYVMWKYLPRDFASDILSHEDFRKNLFSGIQLSPDIFTKEILAFAAAGALAGYGVYLLTGQVIPAVVRKTNRIVRRAFRSMVGGNEPPRAPIRTKEGSDSPRAPIRVKSPDN